MRALLPTGWMVIVGLALLKLGPEARRARGEDESVLRSAALLRERRGAAAEGPESPAESRERLRAHFARVEKILVERTEESVAAALERLRAASGEDWSEADELRWAATLRLNRAMQIERLRDYARQGRFPLNEGFCRDAPAPIFVDHHDTACAVGHLMRQSGWGDAVAEIQRTNNLVYVPDVHDGPLVQWVLQSGLTQEEAALIQPGYMPCGFRRWGRGDDLRGMNFSGLDLAGERMYCFDFSNADFSGANLRNTQLSTLITDANFTGADVQGAYIGGMTSAQLYSTASYQARDLTGIGFYGSDLSGWNLAGQNLASANLNDATLADANFTGAEVRGAYFNNTDLTSAQLYSTASYQDRDLSGVNLQQANLSGGNFAGQQLTNASLYDANLTSTDFSDADVRGVGFGRNNLTAAQLYSTASYQEHDLAGVRFLDFDQMSGWNFAGQNLTNASFAHTDGVGRVDLSGSSFSGANLTNASLNAATLANADFSEADVRGATLGPNMTSAQLYSTASYQARDLTGINLGGDLSGWVFTGQKLTGAFLGRVGGADFSGAGVRGAGLGGLTSAQLYSTASYQEKDLAGVRLYGVDLSGWSFAGQNLANAYFDRAKLDGADFSGANVRGANLGPNMTSAQLYSTASYQARDLTGIDLGESDLSGWDFSGQNLTNASLQSVGGADFSGADVRGAHLGGLTSSQLYSTASYQTRDLTGISLGYYHDLSGWDFAGQNLTNAQLWGATLTDVDFTDADVRGAVFQGSNLTSAQLYSTASYQAGDLSGINFDYLDLSNWNFAGQNLTNASFWGSGGFGGLILWVADFSGADLRGAEGLNPVKDITTNAIFPTGRVYGLVLGDDQLFRVRDYDGRDEWFDPAGDGSYESLTTLPVTILDEMSIAPGGRVRMEFEEDSWDSLISFEPGIPVELGGTLELTFADGVDVASQVGRTLRLFDWTGVSPVGQFTVASPYVWDASKLYTTGEVTLLATADFNGDGAIDAADVAAWQANFGLNGDSDSDGDGDSDGADFLAWQRQLGGAAPAVATHNAVPEPEGLVLTAWLILIAGVHAGTSALSQLDLAISRRALAPVFPHEPGLAPAGSSRNQAVTRR